MYFLLNLSYYVKSYGHLCQILAFFTMPALQIWPCHVTQEANFEKMLFFPNSAFNTGKSCKISSRKALCFRSYQPKTSQGGGKHPPPPVLLGLIEKSKIILKICCKKRGRSAKRSNHPQMLSNTGGMFSVNYEKGSLLMINRRQLIKTLYKEGQ